MAIEHINQATLSAQISTFSSSAKTATATAQTWAASISEYLSPTSSQTASPQLSANSGTSPVLSAETLNYAIQNQTPPEETTNHPTGDTSWFEKLNQWGESDRKLLQAITGYWVNEMGQFCDENHEPLTFHPEGDLTHHTLRSFMMELHCHRYRDGEFNEGEDLTISQFKEMMEKVEANVMGMGERFNDEYLKKGLAYFERLSA